jgi:peptidyl-prolyl cis-trans isomerase SurA
VKFNLLSRAGAFIVAALLLTMLLAVAASAQEEGVPRVVDEVIAQVNDQVLTLSMLKREMKEASDALRAQKLELTAEQADAEVAKRQNEIIVALINEQLMVQKGKELGLAEDVEAQVNRRLLEIAQQQGIKTIEQLEEVMRREGLEPATVRQTMRNEAMKGQVLGSEVDRKIYLALTDTEVRSYYDAHKDTFRKPEMVTLSEIFLNSAGKPDADVLARAQKLVAQLRAGADFKATAAKESEREDEKGVRVAVKSGGAVGSFPVAEISNKPVADAIKGLKAGSIAEPIKTEQGYIILRVDERTPMGEPVFDENKVRETMTYERIPKEREAYLRNLRQEAYIEVAPAYRDALLPLLKTETQKTASATAPAPAKKDDKKKKP